MSALKVAILLLCVLYAVEASRRAGWRDTPTTTKYAPGVQSISNSYCNTQAGYTLTGAGPCAGGSAYLGSVSECCDHCSGDPACRGFDFDMRNGRCYCAAYWGGYQPHADIVAGNIFH